MFFRYDTLEDSRKQFCIKVPKRLGNAVRRNRIKRVLREVLRSNKDRFKPGTRAIILVKSVPDTNETNCVFEDIMRYVEHA